VGLVRDEDGNPVEGARVYFTQAPVAVPDISALTASDGSFSLTAPVDGAYTVESRSESLRAARETVSVRRGEEAGVEISLKSPGGRP
jgi:Carboxypeptidase regulatory-like domain